MYTISPQFSLGALVMPVIAFIPFVVIVAKYAALISLMPAHPWPIVTWISGCLGLLVVVGHLVRYQREDAPDRFDTVQSVFGGCLSIPVYGAMIAARRLRVRTERALHA